MKLIPVLAMTTLLSVAEVAAGLSAPHPALVSSGRPAAGSADSAGRATWQQIPIPKLPPFHPQEPRRVQLANGMVIFLQEDHELPLIQGVARIRGGSRDE